MTTYYAKAASKRKKHGKKCFYCKNKRHTTSECCKREQKEKLSGSNLALNTSSGKTSGKSTSSKSLLAKSSSWGSSSRTSSRTTDSVKIVAADSNSDTSSDSDNTVQVFMAHAIPDEDIERIYKMKAKLCQCNLQHRWLINSGASQTMCSH